VKNLATAHKNCFSSTQGCSLTSLLACTPVAVFMFLRVSAQMTLETDRWLVFSSKYIFTDPSPQLTTISLRRGCQTQRITLY